MSGTSLQRLQRILIMVPWLLDNPGAHIEDLAEQFGARPEDIVTDLDILGYCGLPGYGGGDLVEVSVMGDRVTVRLADFFRRPLRLTLREATTLLLAAEALASVGHLHGTDHLGSGLQKLQDLVAAEASSEPRLAVELAETGGEHLAALEGAVAQRRLVRLVYRSASKGETTQREVEPWELVNARGAWYLQGYCRTVDAPRDFRLDRVRELELTDEEVPAGRAARPPAYEPGDDDLEVVVDLAPPAWWLTERVVAEAVTERPGWRRVTFRTRELDWAARLLLRVGADATVVTPPALAERVRALARDTLARYAPRPPAGKGDAVARRNTDHRRRDAPRQQTTEQGDSVS